MIPPTALSLALLKDDDHQLYVNGDSIAILHSEQIDQLPWANWILMWCWNAAVPLPTVPPRQQHLASGAKRVLFSQPAESTCRCHHCLWHQSAYSHGDQTIVSMPSCSTNCVVPVIKVLNDSFGIDGGVYHHHSLGDE